MIIYTNNPFKELDDLFDSINGQQESADNLTVYSSHDHLKQVALFNDPGISVLIVHSIIKTEIEYSKLIEVTKTSESVDSDHLRKIYGNDVKVKWLNEDSALLHFRTEEDCM